MDKRKRITAIYLGALLLDGIIPADLKIIEKTIDSLNRAALHIEFETPYEERIARDRAKGAAEPPAVPPDIAAIQAFSATMGLFAPPPPSRQQARNDAHNRRAQDNDTDPNNAS